MYVHVRPSIGHICHSSSRVDSVVYQRCVSSCCLRSVLTSASYFRIIEYNVIHVVAIRCTQQQRTASAVNIRDNKCRLLGCTRSLKLAVYVFVALNRTVHRSMMACPLYQWAQLLSILADCERTRKAVVWTNDAHRLLDRVCKLPV